MEASAAAETADLTADRVGRRFDCGWVVSSASILAKCKTAPAWCWCWLCSTSIVNHQGECHLSIDGEMGWRKAIPQDKDVRQSRALALTVGALLIALSIQTIAILYPLAARFPVFVFGAFGISVFFALTVFGLKAATAPAAASGAMIYLLLIIWTSTYPGSLRHTALLPLILLFVLTFCTTRMGRQRK